MGNIFQNAWNWTEQNIGGAIERASGWMREHEMPDIYVGAKSTNDGKNWDPNIKIETNNQIPNSKPQAYSRTTAATAKDIAQGGMTKDEVQEFNIKHPNETALRGQQ